MGQGVGLQGSSYAIPSMSGLEVLAQHAADFSAFAQAHPEKHFFVTEIGCGIAGYHVSEVAPLFAQCCELQNVSLPASFWAFLGR